MKKRLTAILLLLLVLLSAALPAAPARAESYTVYVIENTLKVYSKVSTSSSVLGTMSYGESMTCLATNQSWAAVKNSSGQIGYCRISSLSTSNPNTLNKTAYINSANVPVYRKPSTSSSVMMTLKKNSKYTAVAVTEDQNWVRLKNGNYYGYVQAKYISASAQEDSGSGDSTAQDKLNTTVYIASNTLKVYNKASTSGKVLGTMSYGESMTLLAISGSWAQVRNSSGTVGYCKFSGLSNVDPNSYSVKIYINANGVKVYRKPTTSAGVMQTLKQNDSYTCVAVTPDGDWLRLKNGKYYGYVQSKYASNLKIEEETPAKPVEQLVYISANTLPVYKSASSASTKLGTMSFGETLVLLNVDDGWAQVRNDAGAMGYCVYGGITKTNPNTLQKTAYAAQNGVNLYAKPSESASVSQTLNLNAAVAIIAISEDEDWARVNLGSGKYAYVQTALLSENKQVENDSPIQDVSAVTVYVSDTTLVCYAENNTSAAVLGTMSFGESMTMTGTGEGWARVVNSSKKTGYCKLSGLTQTNPNSYSVTLYAQSSGVKIYTKASTSASVLTTLNLNSKITAVAKSADGSWIRLKNGSDYGYALSENFATSALENDKTSATISKVITLAKEQLGVSYVYAAQSPSTGFDCSGFTYYVFKNAAGVTLKRTAHTQGYNSSYTTISDRSDLKIGDLVFFNTVDDGDDDLCDHVGIYLGNNQFIHASSAKGQVTISSLGKSDSDYYYRTFAWGKRIIQ